MQNGFTITSNSDWENSDDYWWFMGDQRNYGATLSVLQYFDDDICALVNYTHYTHDDGPGLSIGIRDICTHDSMETVLTKLDLPQVLEASARVADIAATYPYEEAATMIHQDQSFNFFDPDQQASLHFGGSLTGAGDENGVTWISAWGFSMYYDVDGINYSIDFEFEENMLTNVWCHIHA